jgi:hypothetical protein
MEMACDLAHRPFLGKVQKGRMVRPFFQEPEKIASSLPDLPERWGNKGWSGMQSNLIPLASLRTNFIVRHSHSGGPDRSSPLIAAATRSAVSIQWTIFSIASSDL